MTPKPISASSSDTVQAVTDLFTKYELSTMPVTNNLGKVIGIISEVSILKTLIKAKALGGLASKLTEMPEVMDAAVSVLETDTIQAVVQIVLKTSIHRVVVLDATGRLKGVVSPKDLLAALNEDGVSTSSLHEDLRDMRDKVKKGQS